jgi:small neutral amino acid transporter SnatA (MarC family)
MDMRIIGGGWADKRKRRRTFRLATAKIGLVILVVFALLGYFFVDYFGSSTAWASCLG